MRPFSKESLKLKALSLQLLQGGVAIIPTDTIYGLVGRALNKKTVERIYRIKQRTPTKPFIILITDIRDLKKFGIVLNAPTLKRLNAWWPGAVSVILPCKSARFSYLHRGTNSLAFRMPKPVWLRNLIKKTGPLVAPSANPEGKEPAKNIREARAYFSDAVDAYSAGGTRTGKPSTLVSFLTDEPVVLRPGAGKIIL